MTDGVQGGPGPTPDPERKPGMALRVALWLVQVILFAGFGIAGFIKLTLPIPELAEMLGWPGDIPAALVRFIAAAELAGAVGVLLPALTRIRPGLTPLAATGLLVVMLLATAFHVARGEIEALPFPLVLGGLAAFVAWGRTLRVPIRPRGAADG